jgi:hypothetical protein
MERRSALNRGHRPGQGRWRVQSFWARMISISMPGFHFKDIRVTVVTAALVACFGGCSPPTRPIAGQVFIMTGTSTIRLPLTKICLMELPVASEFLRTMEQTREANLAQIAKDLNAADAEIQSFNANQQPALAKAQKAEELFSSLYVQEHQLEDLLNGPRIGFENSQAAKAKLQSVREQMDVARQYMKPQQELDRLVRQERELLATRVSLLEQQVKARSLSHATDIGFTPGPVSATSDADGKFDLHAPKRQVVLFARFAARTRDEESYMWLVRVSSEQNVVMLTDKNLLDSSAPENLASQSLAESLK